MNNWLNAQNPHGMHAGKHINHNNSFWYFPNSPNAGNKSSRSNGASYINQMENRIKKLIGTSAALPCIRATLSYIIIQYSSLSFNIRFRTIGHRFRYLNSTIDCMRDLQSFQRDDFQSFSLFTLRNRLLQFFWYPLHHHWNDKHWIKWMQKIEYACLPDAKIVMCVRAGLCLFVCVWIVSIALNPYKITIISFVFEQWI